MSWQTTSRRCTSRHTGLAGRSFRERGIVLLIGPFTDRSGAMTVFTTQAADEEFVAGDPLALDGVIRRWFIREWMEAIDKP